ncbi:hypothetical protein T484DRAFT_1941297 [Baffinella frigidus]|nr:hypothetical protein T484DRAFT_1941297 [Cryptophyta sp. CCMP2293]
MKILQAMQGKTESPLLAKLFKSKRMRGVLAAAIGSARSQEGSDGGNLAFELGNIVSGQATAKHLAAAPRAAPRAAPHHIQQMRQRHAAAIPRAALPKPPAPAPVKKYVRDEGGSFDYDAFAPGVLPGTAAFKPKETAAQKATDAARAKELAGVEIATGFSDKAVASDMREDKLEAQVKALKKAGAAQKALLTGEVTAERAKEVARAKQAADKAAMLAKVKAKAVEAKAKARKVLENSPAAKAARAKAREEKEEVAVKAAQQAKIDKLVSEEMAHLSSQSDIINEPMHRRATAAFKNSPGNEVSAAADDTSAATLKAAGKDTDLGTARAGGETPVGDAAAKGGGAAAAAAEGGGAKTAKKEGTLQGLRGAREDWHVLAKKSKALARKAAVRKGGASVAEETREVAEQKGVAPARVQGGEGPKAWVTTVRKGPLPYLCGVPLVEDVAESKGIDCRTVHHKAVLAGDNKILTDIDDVGLGDDELPIAKQMTPEYAGSKGQAVRALGYTDAEQYERHSLLKTIADQQAEIDGFKRKVADETGGLVSKSLKQARRRELHEIHKAIGAQEAKISALRSDENDLEGDPNLRSLALEHALRDDVGHIGDEKVAIEDTRGGVDLDGATVQ